MRTPSISKYRYLVHDRHRRRAFCQVGDLLQGFFHCMAVIRIARHAAHPKTEPLPSSRRNAHLHAEFVGLPALLFEMHSTSGVCSA